MIGWKDRIVQGDCLDVLAQMPDESMDLVFADPPFNVGKQYGHSDNRKDYQMWCSEWIKECWRLLKPTGSFYLMTLPRYLEWKMPLMAKYGLFINLISWRNVASCNKRKRQFWNEYQPILLYAKSENYIFNTYAEIQDSGMRRWGGYKTEFKGQMKDRWDDIPFVYAGSIKHKEAILKPGTRSKAHPCQMPEGLARRAILFSTNEGDIVLDPMMGSGTVALVAKRMGSHYIGIEISEAYVALAQRRLDNLGGLL